MSAARARARPWFARLFALGLVLAPLCASAATIVVKTASDGDVDNPATCTFRQAIAVLNSRNLLLTNCTNSGGAFGVDDLVTFDLAAFPNGFFNEIVLADSAWEVDISHDVTIDATANGEVVIQRLLGATSRLLLAFDGTTLTMRHVALVGGGGAIRATSPAQTVNLVRCRISGGRGTAIFSRGALNLTDTTVSGNEGLEGGGIRSEGPVTLVGSTVSGNKAALGGGIQLLGSNASVDLTNSTISGNTADYGGGVYAPDSAVRAFNSTISGNVALNEGGGIFGDSVQPRLVNTILAGNSPGDLAGVGVASTSVGNLIGGDPRLGTLGNRGGRTPTRVPLPLSPAIGAIGCASTPLTDQRGTPRPTGTLCDIGAVEATLAEATSKTIVAQAFGAATIPLNGTTSLTITVTNPNPAGSPTAVTLTGIAVTDNLPAGLVVATPSGLTNTCGGTATANAGGSSVTLSGATLAAGASCSVGLTVQGTTTGTKNNSVSTTSTNGTAGALGNTANASVSVSVSSPTISKTFAQSRIFVGDTTTMTFTLGNPNAVVPLTSLAVTDAMPAGIVVATPNGLTNDCGGTATAVPGSSSVSLSGATLAAGASCTVTTTVRGTAVEFLVNRADVFSANAGQGMPSSAQLDVVARPPSITGVFAATTVELFGTTSLVLTVTNPNPSVAQVIRFEDALPAGIVVATPNDATNSCGGTLSAAPGSRSVELADGSLAGAASCVVSVRVKAETPGGGTNIASVFGKPGGYGDWSTTSLSVSTPQPATIAQSFGAATIALDNTTTLTTTLTNPNANGSLAGDPLTGLAFTDTLPGGLVIATPSGLTTNCSGTVAAVAGSNSASLSGGSLPAGGACTFVVNVTGTAPGVKNNSVQASSAFGGNSNTANATLTVTGPLPPTIAQAFGTPAILLNEVTSLTFTLTNPNVLGSGAGDPLVGIAFAADLPSGLVIATPSALSNACGGVAVATAGSASPSLSGVSLAAGASCTFAVNVKGTSYGTKNSSVQVSATRAGNGNTASATLAVMWPPQASQFFQKREIDLGGVVGLALSVSNFNDPGTPNGDPLTDVAFTNPLPAGLVVATPGNVRNTCGGTATIVAGATSVSLAGVSLAPDRGCTLLFDVRGVTEGVKQNSLQATAPATGSGNTVIASLTVGGSRPPTIATAFSDATVALNEATSLTVTVANPNAVGVGLDAPMTAVAFNDLLPPGMVVATPNLLASTCSGTVTAAPGAESVRLAGGTLAASTACTVVVAVRSTTSGVKNNSVRASAAGIGFGKPANAMLVVQSCEDADQLFCNGFDGGQYEQLPVTIVSGMSYPTGIDIDPSGNLFVIDAQIGRIVRVTAPAYATATPVGGAIFTLAAPSGIAVSDAGDLFVASLQPAGFTTLGLRAMSAPDYATTDVVAGGNPNDVDIDAARDLFVIDLSDNSIKRWSAPDYTGFATLAIGFGIPQGIAVDANGNVYVTLEGEESVKKFLAPDYSTVVTVGYGLTRPAGLAVDTAGNVFVADFGANAVRKIAAPDYKTVVTLSVPFVAPYGIELDAAGNVFVVSDGNGQGSVKMIRR